MQERLKDRSITESDMLALAAGIRSNPLVPNGPWCKDFGTFKLAGNGALPKTFLKKDQRVSGYKFEGQRAFTGAVRWLGCCLGDRRAGVLGVRR